VGKALLWSRNSAVSVKSNSLSLLGSVVKRLFFIEEVVLCATSSIKNNPSKALPVVKY
jgi:hypothetical protein